MLKVSKVGKMDGVQCVTNKKRNWSKFLHGFGFYLLFWTGFGSLTLVGFVPTTWHSIWSFSHTLNHSATGNSLLRVWVFAYLCIRSILWEFVLKKLDLVYFSCFFSPSLRTDCSGNRTTDLIHISSFQVPTYWATEPNALLKEGVWMLALQTSQSSHTLSWLAFFKMTKELSGSWRTRTLKPQKSSTLIHTGPPSLVDTPSSFSGTNRFSWMRTAKKFFNWVFLIREHTDPQWDSKTQPQAHGHCHALMD